MEDEEVADASPAVVTSAEGAFGPAIAKPGPQFKPRMSSPQHEPRASVLLLTPVFIRYKMMPMLPATGILNG